MDTLILFLAFFAVALVGWCVAELKTKADNYSSTGAEDAAMQQFLDNQKKGGYQEMDIRGVIKNISTKGFSAI